MLFKDQDLDNALKNLREMEREVERLLKDFFVSKNPILMMSAGDQWFPHIDVFETQREFVVKMEIAGVNKEDIKLRFSDGMLIISGRRIDECEEERLGFHLMEISYGRFERRIPLPDNLDIERVKAIYDRGILKVSIPKAPEVSRGPVVIQIED